MNGRCRPTFVTMTTRVIARVGDCWWPAPRPAARRVRRRIHPLSRATLIAGTAQVTVNGQDTGTTEAVQCSGGGHADHDQRPATDTSGASHRAGVQPGRTRRSNQVGINNVGRLHRQLQRRTGRRRPRSTMTGRTYDIRRHGRRLRDRQPELPDRRHVRDQGRPASRRRTPALRPGTISRQSSDSPRSGWAAHHTLWDGPPILTARDNKRRTLVKRGFVVAVGGAAIVIASLSGCSSEQEVRDERGNVLGRRGGRQEHGHDRRRDQSVRARSSAARWARTSTSRSATPPPASARRQHRRQPDRPVGRSRQRQRRHARLPGAASARAKPRPRRTAAPTRSPATAIGVDMANPMQPVNKPFEIEVTCP